MRWRRFLGGGAREAVGQQAHLLGLDPEEPNTVATGVAVFPNDFRTIRRFAERTNTTIVHWSELERGSHFAAMDAPDLLVDDLREFFRRFR